MWNDKNDQTKALLAVPLTVSLCVFIYLHPIVNSVFING